MKWFLLLFGFTMLLKNGQKEKKRCYISEEKKLKKNHNSVTIIKFVDKKRRIFPLKLKLEGELSK